MNLFAWLRRRHAAPPAVPPVPVPPVVAPRLILLVEDDANDAHLALLAIRKAGHACNWTQSGEAALFKLAQAPYRMVFVDIGLIGMDGWELVRRIRVEFPLMPIWIFTGEADNLFGVTPGMPISILVKSDRWDALADAVAMTAP